MRLYGVVDKVEMKKFPAFDQKTGVPDPGYILQMMVMDLDDKRVYHQCSFDKGFGLEDLQAARKAKASEAERDQLATRVEAEARKMEGQRVQFVIGKVRSKGFVSLSVVGIEPAA